MSTEGDQIVQKNLKWKLNTFVDFLRHFLLRETYLLNLCLLSDCFHFSIFVAKKEVFWPAFGQILENCWCLNHLWSRKFWSKETHTGTKFNFFWSNSVNFWRENSNILLFQTLFLARKFIYFTFLNSFFLLV